MYTSISFLPTKDLVHPNGHASLFVGVEPEMLTRDDKPALISTGVVLEYNKTFQRGKLQVHQDADSKKKSDGSFYVKNFSVQGMMGMTQEDCQHLSARLKPGMEVFFSAYAGAAKGTPNAPNKKMRFPVVNHIEENTAAYRNQYTYQMVLPPETVADFADGDFGTNIFVGEHQKHMKHAHFCAHEEKMLDVAHGGLEEVLRYLRDKYTHEEAIRGRRVEEAKDVHWAHGSRLFRHLSKDTPTLNIMVNPFNFKDFNNNWEAHIDRLLAGEWGPYIKSVSVLKILDHGTTIGNYEVISDWYPELVSEASFVSAHCRSLVLLPEAIYFNQLRHMHGQEIWSEGRSEGAFMIGVKKMTYARRGAGEDIETYVHTAIGSQRGARSEREMGISLEGTVLVAHRAVDGYKPAVRSTLRGFTRKGERRSALPKGLTGLFIRTQTPEEAAGAVKEMISAQPGTVFSPFFAITAGAFFGGPFAKDARCVAIVHTHRVHPAFTQLVLGDLPSYPISDTTLVVDIGKIPLEDVIKHLQEANTACGRQGQKRSYKAIYESAGTITTLCGADHTTVSRRPAPGAGWDRHQMGGRPGTAYLGGLDAMTPLDEIAKILDKLEISGHNAEWAQGPRPGPNIAGAFYIKLEVQRMEDYEDHPGLRHGALDITISCLPGRTVRLTGRSVFEKEEGEEKSGSATPEEAEYLQQDAVFTERILRHLGSSKPLFESEARKKISEAGLQAEQQRQARRTEHESASRREKARQEAEDEEMAVNMEAEEKAEAETRAKSREKEREEANKRSKEKSEVRAARISARGAAKDSCSNSDSKSDSDSDAPRPRGVCSSCVLQRR
jgi:hypothetical protein